MKITKNMTIPNLNALIEATESYLQKNNSIYVTNAPPLANNTNTETKTEFVLFFKGYFGGGVGFLGGRVKVVWGESRGFDFCYGVKRLSRIEEG